MRKVKNDRTDIQAYKNIMLVQWHLPFQPSQAAQRLLIFFYGATIVEAKLNGENLPIMIQTAVFLAAISYP